MFTENEYTFYNHHADRAISGEGVIQNDVTTPADEMDQVSYFHNGDDAINSDFTNVVIYHDLSSNNEAYYYIDIFTDRIEFEYAGDDGDLHDDHVLSTELFSTGSDEEFFQVGTVEDLLFIEEKLLRKFIKLSLMARHNQKIRESK